METAESTFCANLLKTFQGLTSNPEFFLDEAQAEAKGFANVTKKLFHNSIEANSLTHLKSNSLNELLVEGFHVEQIWQQMELQNKPVINLSKLDSNSPKFDVKIENASLHNGSIDQGDLSDDGSLGDDSDGGSLSDDYQDPLSDGAGDDKDQLFDEGDSSDGEEEIKKPKSILKKPSEKHVEESDDNDGKSSSDPSVKYPKKRKYKSEVDDRFFKLQKLEQFLKIEDLKEERARDGEINKDEESDEELSEDKDIDLFQDIPSDDEVENEEESEDEDLFNKKTSKEIMYEDFFDAPDSDDEENVNETSDQELNEKLSDAEIDKEDSEEDEAASVLKDDSESISKTPFELEQEKVKQQIEDYEEKMLKPAAWHLTGEVESSSRPRDALLHLQTDFEMNAKPVVIQDKPLCEKLESMLKTTIKNKAFSDGVKQFKTNDEIISKKKEIVVEQTKSKKSLAQEYEDMYLKKKHGEEEVENPKHKEIKKLMDSLFPELHALFSHIPKPAIPEIKIVSNLPAISVEEVAPTSVSDVTLLAPEEIKKRTGIIKGQTERTDTDRKRERRKKKFHQKIKQKKMEKESSDKPLSAKAQKREKIDMIRKLKQQRNTKFAKTDGQKVKSSKDFFERLQDTVSSTVSKIQAKKKS